MHKIKIIVVLVAVVLLQFVNIKPVSAATDTCTWTGAASTNWNNTGNWNCSVDGAATPEAGDALIFPESASNKNTTNDLAPLSFTSLQVSGSGYTLSGVGLTLTDTTPLIVNQDATINLNITYAPSMNAFLRVSTTQTLTINGTTTFSGVTGEVNVGGGGFGGTIDFVGNIGGDAGTQLIAVSNATAIVRGAANTFTADTVGAESNAIFDCRSTTCFGDNANNIYTGNGTVELRVNNTFSNDWETSTPSAGTSAIVAHDYITITGAGTVNDPVTLSQQLSGGSLQFTGNITNTGGITIAGNTTGAQIRINGSVSGAGDLTVNSGTAHLYANSTYTGATTVEADAILIAYAPASLGTTAGLTDVGIGGSLQFDFSAPTTVTEPLQIGGSGISGEGALLQIGDSTTLSGDILLVGNTVIANNTISTSLSLGGVISGSANITFAGDSTPGVISIEGSSANTYLGDAYIEGVTVLLSKTSGNALTGKIYVNASATNDAQLQITNAGADQVYDNATIDLTNSSPSLAILVPYDANETVGMVTGDGVISHVQTNDRLTIGSAGGISGTFSGTFLNTDSDGTITKNGVGTWTLSGATADSATELVNFVVNEGEIVWSSTLPAFPITITSGSVLKGSGSVGVTTVNSGGTINVGTSPGCMTLASLSLTSGSTFIQEIDGATACTGYDQTTVTGVANITGATLSVLPTYTPADGAVLTILTAGSVTGTFSGYANGASITANGVTFRINYTATTVTLTKLSGTAISVPNTGLQKQTTLPKVLVLFIAIALFAAAVRRSKKVSRR